MAFNPFSFNLVVGSAKSANDPTKEYYTLSLPELTIGGKALTLKASSIRSTMALLERAYGLDLEIMGAEKFKLSDREEAFLCGELDKAAWGVGVSKKAVLSDFIKKRATAVIEGDSFGEAGQEVPELAKSRGAVLSFFLELAAEVAELEGKSEADPIKALLASVAKVLYKGENTKILESLTVDEIADKVRQIVIDDLEGGASRINKAASRIESNGLDSESNTWILSRSKSKSGKAVGFDE